MEGKEFEGGGRGREGGRRKRGREGWRDKGHRGRGHLVAHLCLLVVIEQEVVVGQAMDVWLKG